MTRYISGLLAIGLIAASPLTPAQDDGRQLEGEIVSVDVSDRTVTVHMADTNRNRTFSVDDDTNVRVYGGFDRGVEGLSDLGEGDEVTLVLSGTRDQERVTQIEQTTVTQASRGETDRQGQMAGRDTGEQQQTMAAQRQDRAQSQQYLPATATPVSYYVLAAGLLLLAAAATLRIVRRTAQQKAHRN